MVHGGTRWIHAGKACKQLGVTRRTLVRWADIGWIVTIRPPGVRQRRLYDLASITKDAAVEPELDGDSASAVIYVRTSTHKQKTSLRGQEEEIRRAYKLGPAVRVVSDVGSGINFKRRGLLQILELVFARRLQDLYVTHRDRLARIAFDLLQHVLRKHGAKIHVVSSDTDTEPCATKDLSDDIISIITVFGARLHGACSHKGRRRTEKEEGAPVAEEAGR